MRRSSPSRPSPSRLAAAAALLATALPGAAGAAARPAQAAAAAPAPEPEGDALLLEVFVNGAPTGKIGEFVRRNGRLETTAAELRDLGLRIDGSDLSQVALADLPDLAFRLDEAELKIFFQAGPSRLIPHALGGGAGGDRAPLRRSGTGFLINYDAAATADRSGLAASTLIEARGFSGLVSAGARFMAGAGNGGQGLTRLDSQIVISDPAHLRRVTIGDLITGALAWTRPVRLGGVQLSTAFDMRPDLVTYPLPTIKGSIAVPSTVDILVDGVRQLTSNVPAGPFTVAGLPVASGAQTIAVQMRDSVGRMTQMDVSAYASASLLAPGLASFSAEAGAIRGGYGYSGGDYRDLAASATWRRGLPALTIEAHAEGARGLAMAGGGASFTIGDLAAASFAIAASDFRGRVDGSLYANITRQTQRYHFSLTAHFSGPRFGDLAALRGDPAPRSFVQASAGIVLGRWGSFDLGYLRLRAHQAPGGLVTPFAQDSAPGASGYRLSAATFAYARQVGRLVQLSASAFHDFEGKGSGLTINLSLPLGRRRQAGASLSRADRRTGASIDLRQTARNVGDLAWEVLASDGPVARGFAQAQLRSPYGTFGGGIDVTGGGVTGQAYASGSIAWMDGSLFAANVIRDSFAIVDLNGAAGIPVFADNRPAGRTNGAGKLILTDLNGFQPNRISFDARNLPLSAAFDRDELVLRTPDHAGAVARFAIKQGAAALVSLVDEKGAPLTVGSSARLDGAAESQPIGYDGQLFLPDAALHNRISVDTAEGRKCVASFDLTSRTRDIAQIGPITCRPI